ncbi:glycosyltransferase [Peribacillus sp. NPDC096379]|uniref:glycosyltransferase n=1 Tax=Peribacillus sp. NPDC096379 TaxID=3364393 RepID=UPI0037F61A0F
MQNEVKKRLVLMIPQMRHGGAERVVSRLSLLMSDFYDIYIVVFDDSKITYEVGCELISLNAKPNPQNNMFKRVLNILKRIYLYSRFKKNNNIDITYSFGDTANLVNVFSFGNDKKVISIRGFKRIRLGKGIKEKYLFKPISKFLCYKSHLIVSVSELMSRTIIKEYKIPSSKIKTIYNGYDVDKIIKSSKERISGDDFVKIGNDRVIVTAGTFRAEKGYWHLLKAFSLVHKKEKDIKLLILGENYCGNKQKIEKLANELNISDNIIYGGYQTNPFKYFSKSSIYVLTSTSEGFPNAMVEAMTCGLPVIASDCKTGPREILAPDTSLSKSTTSIEMGKYGVLVKRMNEHENYNSSIIEDCDQNLADAIVMMLNDENLRNKYADRSRQRANDFSYIEWIKKQNEILLD